MDAVELSVLTAAHMYVMPSTGFSHIRICPQRVVLQVPIRVDGIRLPVTPTYARP
jgi:hypothetical protein